MNSEKAGNIIGLLWDDILIANWFDKEWFESTYETKLTEEQYLEIVELYNKSNWCDYITQEIEEWISTHCILDKVLNK